MCVCVCMREKVHHTCQPQWHRFLKMVRFFVIKVSNKSGKTVTNMSSMLKRKNSHVHTASPSWWGSLSSSSRQKSQLSDVRCLRTSVISLRWWGERSSCLEFTDQTEAAKGGWYSSLFAIWSWLKFLTSTKTRKGTGGRTSSYTDAQQVHVVCYGLGVVNNGGDVMMPIFFSQGLRISATTYMRVLDPEKNVFISNRILLLAKWSIWSRNGWPSIFIIVPPPNETS